MIFFLENSDDTFLSKTLFFSSISLFFDSILLSVCSISSSLTSIFSVKNLAHLDWAGAGDRTESYVPEDEPDDDFADDLGFIIEADIQEQQVINNKFLDYDGDIIDGRKRSVSGSSAGSSNLHTYPKTLVGSMAEKYDDMVESQRSISLESLRSNLP